MQIYLNDGRIFAVTEEKGNEIKAVLTDKNSGDDTEIQGSKNTIKKSDIKCLKQGNYVYTKEGLHKIEEEKPLLFKLYHSNIATDYFIIEQKDLENAIPAMLDRKHFFFHGRSVIPIKILPHPNNHFGWNDDYVPTGEFLAESRKIENKLLDVFESAKAKLEGAKNKRLN